MSRHGFVSNYDSEPFDYCRWRGSVTRALKGKRGQAFLREMLVAMDALPEKKLVRQNLIKPSYLEHEGEVLVCALGSVGLKRGLNMEGIDPEDYNTVASKFDIAESMSREIVYINDDGAYEKETEEQRFLRVRNWIVSNIGEHRIMVKGDL